MPDSKVQLQSGGVPVIAIQVLLPVILSIIAGYGAVRFSSGETTQHLQELERTALRNREDINTLRSNSVTRDEMRLFMESARNDLQEIKADIRAMRYGNGGK